MPAIFICLYASVPGAIVGAGGGVIIKAILDLFNLPLFQPSAFAAAAPCYA